jgi:hypothetical protein
MAIGPSPEISAEIFSLGDGQVSPAIRTQRGFAFVTVVGKQAPRLPKLEEVRDKVRDDLMKQKAFDIAQQKALQVATEAKAGDMQSELCARWEVRVVEDELDVSDVSKPSATFDHIACIGLDADSSPTKLAREGIVRGTVRRVDDLQCNRARI